MWENQQMGGSPPGSRLIRYNDHFLSGVILNIPNKTDHGIKMANIRMEPGLLGLKFGSMLIFDGMVTEQFI